MIIKFDMNIFLMIALRAKSSRKNANRSKCRLVRIVDRHSSAGGGTTFFMRDDENDARGWTHIWPHFAGEKW